MKTLRTLLALLAITLAATTASAQQSVAGQWHVQQVNNTQTPEGTTLAIDFKDNGKAIVTATLAGEAPQSWQFAYTTQAKTLTLTPTTAPGTPQPTTYQMRFDGKKLELLEPLPEPEEGEPAPEDNREPVWVLVKA